MKILLVGGSLAVRGGVELFCERAVVALEEIGGHRVGWIRSNSAYLTLGTLGPFLKCIRDLFANRGQWDCVWLQYVNFPELFLLATCRLLGYRVLVTPHLGGNWASQSRPGLRWVGDRLLGLADGIAVLSETQGDELTLPARVKRLAIKTFLPRVFPPNVRRQEPLALIHAGRLSHGKGTFLFLDVCSRLQDRGRAYQARLIGSADPQTLEQITDIISARGLDPCVTMVGALPETLLMDALASADVLVHLSEIDSFPLIVLEAIACGVFPICKDLPGARQMTRTYCGHIVAGADAAILTADYICDTALPSMKAAAAAGSRLVAAEYGWTGCVAAVGRAVRATMGV